MIFPRTISRNNVGDIEGRIRTIAGKYTVPNLKRTPSIYARGLTRLGDEFVLSRLAEGFLSRLSSMKIERSRNTRSVKISDRGKRFLTRVIL